MSRPIPFLSPNVAVLGLVSVLTGAASLTHINVPMRQILMWTKLAQRSLAAASSIGAVYEALGHNAIPDLSEVQIHFDQLDP